MSQTQPGMTLAYYRSPIIADGLHRNAQRTSKSLIGSSNVGQFEEPNMAGRKVLYRREVFMLPRQ